MRIVGNLDVEVTWSRMDAAARRARGEKAPSPDDPRFALPEPVMRKISAAATLMRVAAINDLDTLWTPRPVEPSRMADVEWLARPRLESGPVPETSDVWWGDATAVAANVNHRAFAQQLRTGARAFGGSTLVRSLSELATQAAEWSEWVAKAPHSAAGRLRVRGLRRGLAESERQQAQRLLDLYGSLLFEPWVRRTTDMSFSGVLDGERRQLLGAHRLTVDGRGRFVGVSVETPDWSRDESDSMIETFGVVIDALEEGRYQGFFGIDAYRYVDEAGATRFQCLSEINARRTFGHVADALVMKARAFLGLGEAESVTLRFGAGPPPDGTIPLLLPGADDDTSAWLETSPRHMS